MRTGGWRSSPRKRGCFLPSAPRRLRAHGLPRVSGGVSNAHLTALRAALSSPRKRGCFHVEAEAKEKLEVFPA